MPEPAIHETLTRDEEVVCFSDRTFGLTLALICVTVGALKLWGGHDSSWLWLAAATVAYGQRDRGAGGWRLLPAQGTAEPGA